MVLKIERTDARTWPDEHLKELFSGFPEFITAEDESVQPAQYYPGIGLLTDEETEAGA